MTIGIDTNSIFPCTGCTQKSVVRQSRQINEVGSGGSSVEKKDAQPQKSIFSIRRELTPEEQRRVELLKNMLVQTLTMAQGDPTEDQKKQIREIEDELAKITGVKTRSRISNVTDKMPGKSEKDEEKEKQEQQAKGIDPKEAVHNNMDIKPKTENPGMQMLRNNAFYGALQTLDVTSLSTSLKGSK